MKRLILVSTFVAFSIGFTAPAVASDTDHIYCSYSEITISIDKSRMFYTAVFLGNYSFTVGYANAFGEYLEKKYNSIGTSRCFFESTPDVASQNLDRKVDFDESLDIYSKVIKTGWAPDDFRNQPLQDFNVTIRDDSAELQICVRDHECEDGDEVRVTVDGNNIFSGEIDNDWDCNEVDVSTGQEYSIELFAINGTGNKGNCSFQDVNTGEIRVGGSNTQTQSWRHRGGAGSRARIIVKPE